MPRFNNTCASEGLVPFPGASYQDHPRDVFTVLERCRVDGEVHVVTQMLARSSVYNPLFQDYGGEREVWTYVNERIWHSNGLHHVGITNDGGLAFKEIAPAPCVVATAGKTHFLSLHKLWSIKEKQQRSTTLRRVVYWRRLLVPNVQNKCQVWIIFYYIIFVRLSKLLSVARGWL